MAEAAVEWEHGNEVGSRCQSPVLPQNGHRQSRRGLRALRVDAEPGRSPPSGLEHQERVIYYRLLPAVGLKDRMRAQESCLLSDRSGCPGPPSGLRPQELQVRQVGGDGSVVGLGSAGMAAPGGGQQVGLAHRAQHPGPAGADPPGPQLG